MSSRIGEYVGYGIMGLGVLAFFWVSVITGVWFFLIGNFLRNAAAASYSQLFVTTVLQGIPARALARNDHPTISPELRLTELAEDYVLAGKGRAFPVAAGEELLGLITLTDLRRVPREEWSTTTVYKAMTPYSDLKTIGMERDLGSLFELMAAGGLNQVPVVEGRLLRGMITRADLMRYLQTRQEIGLPDGG